MPCESSVHGVSCPVKCREVTVKKKRVETFRYGDGRIYYYYTDSAAAVGPGGARSGSPQ